MAESKQNTVVEDDWEEIHASKPDDTISVMSESETLGNNQDYVEVDDPKKTSYPGRIYRDPKDQPVGPLPTLRRSLYALKDTLRESIEQLEDFNQEHADWQALAISGPVMQIQQRQVDALNMLLTNSDADWEKSGREGGMTFDEFAELDPVSIDELNRIMKDFVHEVRLHKYDKKRTEEDDADVAFLDIILPAVDEISVLLRVDEPENEGKERRQEEDLSEEMLMERVSELCLSEDEGAALGDKEKQKEVVHEQGTKINTDQKVHDKMMAISDW